VYTFLTVLHVIVCVFLMLVVLLQAGRGGGIGLAFGGSGGSQSVFGSSGGATFMTKLTAVCAFIFFANSLALAYLSSQSDSKRLQQMAEKKALAKEEAEAASSKIMTEIEKEREAKAKAEAAKSEGLASEGTAGEEESPPTTEEAERPGKDQAPAEKAAPTLELKLPGATTTAPAGKLGGKLKLVQTDSTSSEKPAAEDKPAAKKPAAKKKPVEPATDKSAAEKPAGSTSERPAEE
jgi:preprotein translocase subunit SecG